MTETWAIILAAGESVRMQSNKMLLHFHGKTIIETVIDQAMQPDIDKILVVLGAYRDDMLPLISRLPVVHCYNPEYKTGMLSSVQCGFRNLSASVGAAIIFLGDQPTVPGEVAGLLIREYRKSGKGIVMPAFRGKRGHPVLIDMKFSEAIAKISNDGGLHTLMREYPGDILELDVEIPEILKDMDTPQDYLALTNQHN